MRWSKESFGNNLTELRKTQNRLRMIKEGQPNRNTKEEEITLRNQIRNLWWREELYWKQRTKIKWLTKGDHNTTFFYLTTASRRRWNHIGRLMDNRGRWLTMEDEINQKIHSHFKLAFQWETPVVNEETLESVQCQINESMNTQHEHFKFGLKKIIF